MNAKSPLKVPCSYQGGKQRVSKEIIDSIFEMTPNVDEETRFYDLCCGSGAITLELINRGIRPEQITMLDISSWGAFWREVGGGEFDIDRFRNYMDAVPTDKHKIREHMIELSGEDASADEPYKYLLLQASSFGGKQIWRDGAEWKNAFFRSYWEPTETSVRRSPANPMQPGPGALFERVSRIAEECVGLNGLNEDIATLLDMTIPANSIIYIDPPYHQTTGYGFGFNLREFTEKLRNNTAAKIFISEGFAITENSQQLTFGGAKGGISGNKSGKHQEWLTLV